MKKESALKTLGTFIRKKREMTKPEIYKLPTGKRKTPGLRREEVCVLSGISISLYTLIEQGQYDHPSVDVLKSIARILKMDDAELNHMLFLSENSHIVETQLSGEVASTIMTLLNDFNHTSAMVLDSYWNIQYANQNLLENLNLNNLNDKQFILTLLDDELTKDIVNINELREYFIAVFRFLTSPLYEDKHFQNYLNKTLLKNDLFKSIWSKHEVVGNPTSIKLKISHNDTIKEFKFLPFYPVTDSNFIVFTFIDITKESSFLK